MCTFKWLLLQSILTFLKFKNLGRYEKGCLLSTENNAAVNINRQPDSSFLGQHQPGCFFLLVDVVKQVFMPKLPQKLKVKKNLIQKYIFFIWSTSTTLHFASQWTVDTVDVRQHPFYNPFHHAQNFSIHKAV